MSFFSKISDEALGGTYMTFLTTLTNLGGSYLGTLAMFSIDWLTRKHCLNSGKDTTAPAVFNNTCSSSALTRVSRNKAERLNLLFLVLFL